MANSADPDETPRSAASHLGLHCLLRPVCPNTWGKYGILNFEKVHFFCLLVFPKVMAEVDLKAASSKQFDRGPL